ncbi:hypothetical protein Airi01_065500 [Actinoallomurus iriomotensis]|uniref:Uncharacterized protein n=2 Tax=Actinoallomurus iriomotensis TaxID=478107 RepID=A0A9W6RMA2_9ACTN|nr:hypothetical protein Airi01_065500 [Actinoallomurus iriomotensis]
MCGMSERPPQRPEGELIERAQKLSGLSQRKAAPRAGISENRWRNIVSGYQTVSAGVYAPVTGPPDTVARMARAVGVTAEQLDQAGREDAAEELRRLGPLEETDAAGTTVAELAQRLARQEKITAQLVEETAELRRRLTEITGKDPFTPRAG